MHNENKEPLINRLIATCHLYRLVLIVALSLGSVAPVHAARPAPQIDPNVVFYVSNFSGAAIEKVDSYGVDLGVFATMAADGLAADAAGNIFADNKSQHLLKRFGPGGATVIADQHTLIPGSNGFFPLGMVFDASGNLFVANAVPNTPGEILKFAPDGSGGYTPSVFAAGPSWLAQPFALALDSAGNLYVSNYDSNAAAITRFTPSGQGSLFARDRTNLYHASGMAFDSSGNLFVADYNNDLIEEFDPSGAGSIYFSDNPASPSYLNGPIGLAFDSFDNLYAASSGSQSIAEFDSFGPSGFASAPSVDLSGPGFILIQPNTTAVPEPATMALAMFAILGAILIRPYTISVIRRHRNQPV